MQYDHPSCHLELSVPLSVSTSLNGLMFKMSDSGSEGIGLTPAQGRFRLDVYTNTTEI